MIPIMRIAILLTGLSWLPATAAAPVPVRFVEGVGHGFLTLRTADAAQIASGDLLQVVRRGEVHSRMVFRKCPRSCGSKARSIRRERPGASS
jgi:hypothetical protein